MSGAPSSSESPAESTPLAAALEALSANQHRALRERVGLTSAQLVTLAENKRQCPPAPWLARAIADELGRNVRELFPSR